MKIIALIKISIAYIAATLLFVPISYADSRVEKSIAVEASMTVYKTPSCGCCKKWIDHVSDNGLQTSVVEMNDLSTIKIKYDIQGRYRSCHTGIVSTELSDYVFEGHVPAKYIKQFLTNPPAGAIGLSVPGMPIGSPGMEVGERKDYYQVLLLKQDGSSSVFAHVNN